MYCTVNIRFIHNVKISKTAVRKSIHTNLILTWLKEPLTQQPMRDINASVNSLSDKEKVLAWSYMVLHIRLELIILLTILSSFTRLRFIGSFSPHPGTAPFYFGISVFLFFIFLFFHFPIFSFFYFFIFLCAWKCRLLYPNPHQNRASSITNCNPAPPSLAIYSRRFEVLRISKVNRRENNILEVINEPPCGNVPFIPIDIINTFGTGSS